MSKNVEKLNTSVLKLVKTDQELVDELKMLMETLVGHLSLMVKRDLICNLGLDNGEQSGNPDLTLFQVNKRLANERKVPQQ
jgi:hypothetical protein